MKRLFLLLLFVNSFAYAQNYSISSVIELQNDLAARRNVVTDSSGIGCALIRVNIPSVNNIKFDSSIVGEVEFLPGEYNVYLPEYSNLLSVSVDGEWYDIDFSKFNITIEEKKCYRVIFRKNINTNVPVVSKTSINANYDNVVVLIDGVPVGQTPLQLDNISLGEHILSVPNTNGVTMRDTTIVFTENNIINLFLHKEDKKTVIVDMATPGGDSCGWYNVFGTNIKEENGKVGVVEYTGDTIVPFEFDYIYPGILNGYYLVNKDDKWGLYDMDKGLVVQCVYDNISAWKSYAHDQYMPVAQDDKWGVISPEGELIIPIKYENHPQLYEDVIKVEYIEQESKKEFYGVYSYDGEEIIKPKYEYMNEFVNGYAFFRKYDDTVGFVDIYGNETYFPEGYSVGSSWGIGGTIFRSNLFRVKDKVSGKWGYMNSQLELVIPCIYDAISEYDAAPNFNNGIVLLKLNEDKLVLDSNGNIIVSCKNHGYSDIEIVSRSNSIWNHGRFFEYHDYYDIDNNTLIKVVNLDAKCGLIDTDGSIIVPCKYEEDDIRWFCDNYTNYFTLLNNDEVIICDKHQNELLRLPSNLRILEITDGFIMIKDEESGSYGYLNTKGEILANCIYGNSYNDQQLEGDNDDNDGYDMANVINEQPITEGLAILNIGDRFGFIDNNGNVKVPLIYTAVTPFENGMAYVRQQNGEWKKIYKDEL